MRLFITSLILETDLVYTQQSRFLALVGNYEEYSKALETANNSEGASAQQVLKTMDSIESKLTNVKTAWQQFYASMGLENVFKGTLDVITQIINNINKMSKGNAIMTFFNLFNGVKNLVMGLVTNIIGLFSHLKSMGQESLAPLQKQQNITVNTEQPKQEIESLQEALVKALTQKLNIDTTEANKLLEQLGIKVQNINVPKGTNITAGTNYNPVYQQIQDKLPVNNSNWFARVSGLDRKGRFDDFVNNGKIKDRANNALNSIFGEETSLRNAFIEDFRNYIKENKSNITDEETLTKGYLAHLQNMTDEQKKALIDKIRTNGEQRKVDEQAIAATKTLAQRLQEHAGSARVAAQALSAAGAAITAYALTLKDSSESNTEKSKIWSGAGATVSGLGSAVSGALLGAASGNIVGIVVGALAAGLPSIISGISQIIDGFTQTTVEKLENAKQELSGLQEDETRAKAKSSAYDTGLKELKDLKEAQYDSAEAAQEYLDKMSNLGESYPELVDSMDSAGNAIIEIETLEQALAEARLATARATTEALEKELQVSQLERQRAEEALAGFEGLEVSGADYGSPQITIAIPDNLNENNVKAFLGNVYRNYGGLSGEIFTPYNDDSTYFTSLGGLISAANSGEVPIDWQGILSNLQDQGSLTITLPDNTDIYGGGRLNRKNVFDPTYVTNWLNSVEKVLGESGFTFKDLNLEDEVNAIRENIKDGVAYNTEDVLALQNRLISDALGQIIGANVKAEEKSIKALAQGYAEEELAEMAIDDELYSKVLDGYSGLFKTVGGKLIEDAFAASGATDIATWQNDSVLEDALAPLKNLGVDVYEKIAEIWDNKGAYDPTELESSISDILGDGEDAQKVTEALVSSYAEAFELTRDLAYNQVHNSIVAKDSMILSVLTDSIDSYQAPAELIDDINGTVQSANALYEKGMTANATALITAAELFYKSATSLDVSSYLEVRSILDGLDLTNIEDLTDARNRLEALNTDGQYTDLIDAIDLAIENCSQNIDALANAIADKAISAVEKIGDSIEGYASGFDATEVSEEYKKLEGYEGLLDGKSFDYFFEYDAALGKWVYTNQGIADLIAAQSADLEESNNQLQRVLETSSSLVDRRFLQGITDGGIIQGSSAFYNAEDKTYGDRWTSLTPAQQAYAEWASKKQAEGAAADEYSIDAYTAYLNEQASIAEEMTDVFYTSLISQFGDTIDFEGLVTGAISDSDRESAVRSATEMIRAKFTKEGREFNEATLLAFGETVIQALEEGNYSYYEAMTGDKLSSQEVADLVYKKATVLNDAVLKAIEAPGTIIDEATYNILNEAGLASHIEWDEQGFGVVTEAAANYVEMINRIAEQGGVILEKQNATLAAVYNKALDMDNKKTISDISSKLTISVEDLANLATAQGRKLTDFFNENSTTIKKELGLSFNNFTGGYEIIDFDAYWLNVTGSLNKTTAEYLEAYSNWVDSQIEKSNKKSKEAQSQLDDLLDANIGDQVNVSYLEAIIPNIEYFLGEVVNGVATITEDTNLLGLLKYVTQMDQETNILEDSVGELRDTILDLIKGWADAISDGLSGELSFADAEGLMRQFGLEDTDFSQTKNGLQLSKKAAYDLYLQLKEIAPLQAQLVFDSIADSLSELGSGYEDVASTMKSIAKINEQLANPDVSDARRKELEKELQVAKEILQVRSQDPDSFNFMDKELPDGMLAPENYWNSVGQAYKVINESAQTGYMEIQDYVNIVRHMEAMALSAGVEFEIAGMNAAQLIEKGMSALTNVDGEGVKIAMEGIGFDFLSGAEEMGLSFDDGIKEVAKSQIKMLDAAIRILEAMVAMEDIDVDNSGYLEMDEIFANGEDASKGWTTKVENWAENLNAAAGEITIGGKSLLDALATLDPSDAQKALNALMSIDWDSTKDIASQIQSVLSVFFPGETITQGKSVFDILKIPDDADKNAKHFTEWLNNFDLNVKEYNQIKKALDLNSQISTENNIFKNIEKMLGLEEGDNRFENLYSNLKDLGYGIQDAIKIWDEITVTDEDGKTIYTYNGQEYTDLNQVLAARELQTRLGGEVNNVEINEENGQPVSVSGELTIGEHTINVSLANGQVTYTTSDGETSETERQAIDHEVQTAREENPDGPSETQLYATWGVDLQVEALEKVSVKDIQTVLSGNAIQEAMQGKVDEEGRLTEPITLKVGSENIEFEAGSTEQDIRQKLVEAMGLEDTTLIDAITTAIQTAAPSIGQAISTAISDIFSGTNTEGESSSLTIKPTSLNVDLTNAEIKTTGLSEDGSLPLPDGTIGVVSGTASEIQIDGDYTPVIPEEGITLTYDAVSGETTTIKITPTNYSDDSQTDEVKIDGTYSSVKGKADSATIDITTYTVDITDAEGNTETVTVEGEANLTAIINGLTQGEDGSWTLSLGNSSVIIETPNYDEIVGKLAELSAPETKTITVAYEESPLVGPGVDSTTTGYHVAGIENNFGNKVTLGQFSTLDAAITSMESEISNGTFQNGTFEITEIKADGSTVTTTATLAELTAGVVNLNTNTNNNNNNSNNNNNTHSNDTNTSSTPLSIDTSAIEAQIQNSANAMGASIQGALDGIDTSSAQNAISNLSSKISNIPSSGAGKISSLSAAIGKIPSNKTIKIGYTISVNATGTGVAAGRITSSNATSWGGNTASGTLAKGNALASGSRRTLMGELGPELVVSNGRYFVVGQNGAEFVDLADDAIVFNHLQTQRLLSSSGISGRGTPVTNEKNATSLATGNAMASASDALAQLRAIRAMWQSMLDASAADLGAMAGSGGGGGGGGGGKDIAAVVGDYERWYNLLRQIAKWEQKITYEQAKRENMRSGYNQVDSLEKELDMLKKQQAAYEELAKLQKDFYDKRRQDLLSTDYSLIFTYDEDGLMQYVDGVNRGLDILAKLNERDATGKLINNAKDAKTQLSYLESVGFDTSILKNNEDGTTTKDPEEMMQNFWDNIDGWMDELDSLYDTYNENLTSVEEVTTKQNEILQQYIDNQLSLEQKLLQAIQDREQAEIDRLSDEKEALEEATQSFIDGLTDALDKERDLYNKNQNQKETDKLQRQLAILMRSGGSASEIQALRDQIDSRLQDEYFDKQQEQIDAIQEASDNQLEKLQEQIDLMTETLDYQKENGLLWEEVYNMMNNWTPEQLVQFLDEYTASRRENSALQNEQDREEDRISAEMFVGKRDLEARNAAWERYYSSLTYSDDVKRNNAQAAQTAFNEAYASGGETAAIEAANRIYNTATQVPSKPEEIQPAEDTSQTGGQNAKVKGGQMNVRRSVSSKAKSLGIVKNGKSFKAVGYKGGWLKVEDADVGGGKKVNGYMKYSGYSKYYEGIDINKLPGYSQGGLVDFTGPVMVHGSKSKPEGFLSAEDTALLKSTIFNSNNNVLQDFINALENRSNSNANIETTPNVVIEEVNLEIASGTIANDYDAKRAGEKILEEMVKISRKTTNRVSSRR